MSEEELIAEFGEDGWYELEDEIYRRYSFTPMKVEIEEHHVGVYKSKKDNHFKKADHPAYLLRNSLVSPSLLAGVWNAKYVNATPLYRQEQEFQRMGLNIDRADMAHWTILCAERYLSIFYDYLHQKLYDYHVLQADETPILVSKENRTDGNKHYMWVYRTGKMYEDRQIVLYDYQPSRNASHPRDFLKKFKGVCQEQEFQRMGLNIDRADMAHWTILCAERYLSIFYDYLHQKLYDYHVLQADETPILVSKENRTDGNKHYMWVYRTGKMYEDRQIVLYDYQPSRNASHPRDFLKKFKGVCVTDGYQVYHTIEKEREDLKIAGCWAHARHRFDESVKALPKDKKKSSLAYLALKQIQAIYREENKLADESAEERLSHRQLTVKPLVDAY